MMPATHQQHGFLMYLLLLALAVGVRSVPSTSPTITDPPIAPIKRAIGSEVIGSTTVTAYSSSTTWSCGLGSTWTELRPYAECRTTALQQVPMYTGCLNTSVVIGPFDAVTCAGSAAQTSCVTGLIYYDNNVTLTNYACWPSWTQGNWEAWRETPEDHHHSLAKTLAIAITVPVVVIGIAVALLWFRIKRRRQQRKELALFGRPSSISTVSSFKPATAAETSGYPAEKSGNELDEQRRPSELTSTIEARSARNPEAVADDRSSYHTTNSQVFRAELTGSSHEHDAANVNPHGRAGLDRILQRFRL